MSKPKDRIKLSCAICSSEFETIKSRIYKAKYCSMLCRNVGLSNNRTGDKNPAYKEKIDRTCQICKNHFYVVPGRLKKVENAIYCSKRCKGNAMKVDKIKKICEICDKIYYILPYQESYSKVCSKICRNKKMRMMSKIKTSYTSIEKSINLSLMSQGYIPHLQYSIGVYDIDLAFPDIKLAIECDGDYWHSLPGAKERDKKKNIYLENLGWRVLRFKGSEIEKYLDQCVKVTVETINSLMP